MSVQDSSAATTSIQEARLHLHDAGAPTKHFKEWLRRVPHQAQDLINTLVMGAVSGSPRISNRSGTSMQDMQFVPRAAQYISADSLIQSVVYMSRYFASLKDAELNHQCQAAPLMQLFATCMVLADKFSNDDAYDDLLPAIGIVTGIQPKVLRQREVEMLSFLMNTSSMFVSETEFEAVVYLLEESPWKRLKREGSLDLLKRTAREHASIEALHQHLFTANVRTRSGPGITAHLRAFSQYLRTARPKPPRLSFLDPGTERFAGSFRGRSLSVAGGPTSAAPGSDAKNRPAQSAASASFKGYGRPAFSRSSTTEFPAGERRRSMLPSIGGSSFVKGRQSNGNDTSVSSSFNSKRDASSSAPSSPSNRRRFDLFQFIGRGSKNTSKGASPLPTRALASPVASRGLAGAERPQSVLEIANGLPNIAVSKAREDANNTTSPVLPEITEEHAAGSANAGTSSWGFGVRGGGTKAQSRSSRGDSHTSSQRASNTSSLRASKTASLSASPKPASSSSNNGA